MNKQRKITKDIVIHCSATPPDMDIGRKEIDRWHRNRGFFSIGYHFVIRRDGSVEKGRELYDIGAHAKGFNRESLAICMVGGVDKDQKAEDNFTPDQYRSLGLLVDQMITIFPHAEVKGHRDLPDVQKDCPSFDVKTWWEKEAPKVKRLFNE